MGVEAFIGIVVDAQNRAGPALGAAAQDVKRIDAELNKLRATANNSVASQEALGKKILESAAAHARLREETARGLQQQEKMASALSKVKDELAAHSGAFGNLVGSMGAVTVSGAVVLGVLAAIATASIAAATSVGHYQEQLELAGETSGLTTTELAGLKLAAAETGRSFDQIKPGLDFFARKIKEAYDDAKSAGAKSFEALGISVRGASGEMRSASDVFRETQSAISELAEGPARGTAAFELFGRGARTALGALLTPIDEAIARARTFGLAFGPEQEATARAADVAIDRMAAAFDGLRLRVALALAPLGTSIATGLTSALVGAQSAFDNVDATRAVNEFYRLRVSAEEVTKAVKETANEMAKHPMASREGGMGFGESDPFMNIMNQMNPRQTTGARAGVTGAGPLLGGNSPVASVTDELQKQIDKLNKQVALQPYLLDSALAQLDAKKAEAETQAELNRLVEAQLNLVNKFGPPGKTLGFGPMQEAPHAPYFDLASAEDPVVTKWSKIQEEVRLYGEVEEEKAKKTHDNTLRNITGISTAFAEFFAMAKGGITDMKIAFLQMATKIIGQLASAGAFGASSGSVGAAAGVFGTLLPLLMQSGGIVPTYAQSGVVASGIRGIDTEVIVGGRGEGIVNHTTMDMMSRYFADRSNWGQGQQKPSKTIVFGEGSIVFNGVFSNPDELKVFTREFLIPETVDAINRRTD